MTKGMYGPVSAQEPSACLQPALHNLSVREIVWYEKNIVCLLQKKTDLLKTHQTVLYQIKLSGPTVGI